MKKHCLTSALLAAVLFCSSLTSCGGTAESSGEAALPEDILQALEYHSPENEDYSIRFYFNNTADTRGFFSSKLKADENGVYEHGNIDHDAYISTYSVMQALENSFSSCDSVTTYVIGESYTSADIGWETLDPKKNVFLMTKDDTFFLSRSMNDSLSHSNLLKSLPEPSDNSELSLYLTSLDELNGGMNDLSRWVQSHIGSDGSACLVGFLCDYNGRITGVTENTETLELTGKKVLYLLAAGPDNLLDRYMTDLEQSLQNYSLVYELCYFPSVAITPAEKFDEILVAPAFLTDNPAAESLSKQQLSEMLDSEDFAYNVNLSAVEMTDYSSIFTNVNDYVDMIVCRFDEQGLSSDRMILNVYLPLYECISENREDYSCRISEKFEGTGDAALDQLLRGKDHMNVRVYSAQTSEDGMETTYGYTQMSHYDFTKAGFDVASKIVSAAEVPVDAVGQIPTDAAEYWLQVHLTYRYDPAACRSTSSLLMTVPIYSVMKNTLPQWLTEVSCSPEARKLSNPESLFRTVSLFDFTSSLSGLNSSEKNAHKQLSLNTAMFESKLCDLILYIDGIPTT